MSQVQFATAVLLVGLIRPALGHASVINPTGDHLVSPQTVSETIICKNSRNKPENINKPTVIMISIDGFRADYMQKIKPPFLSQLSKLGSYAPTMRPSFPTHTFPNHYTLVTGRVPGTHGIVSNKFFDKKRNEFYNFMETKSSNDGSWYSGEPLWNVAERNGMIAHSFHWVGSEANINNMTPTCYTVFDGNITPAQKVSAVINWLKLPAEKAPHFITLYFSNVDSAGHKYGPDSQEVKSSLFEIDQQIERLWKHARSKKNNNVNFVIVSDHGMKQLDPNNVIYLSQYTNIDEFTVGERGAVAMLYSIDTAKIQRAYLDLKKNESHYKVYLKDNLPTEYKLAHPDRVGDIVVIGDLGYYIIERSFTDKPSLNAATHGWSYVNDEMKALFVAEGPQIAKKKLIPEFQNIDVYPFVMNILGMTTTVPFDGNPKTLLPYIIKKKR